eukprot:scaffold2142_cov252-Pinguiococcus_pyrenoidosus.AAC.2
MISSSRRPGASLRVKVCLDFRCIVRCDSHPELQDSLGEPFWPQPPVECGLELWPSTKNRELLLTKKSGALLLTSGQELLPSALPLAQQPFFLRRGVAQKLFDVPTEIHRYGRHENEHESGSDHHSCGAWIRFRRTALEVFIVEVASILVAIQLALVFLADVLPQILIVAEVLVVGVDHLIHHGRDEQSGKDHRGEVQHSNEARRRIAGMEAKSIEGVVPALDGAPDVLL